MKAVEEPACLSVGTDVSAKYRGAFCEAKIKTVKRLVKVKVNLKAEGTSQVVHDDQVKGQLRVGSVVEVRTGEGGSSEAVISKLTDASLYTVVFDDGDEKTLRRTSLCLKGERHFAESETLDQLPLTNPEHFGTPVIGKKSNRGRRCSQAVADEENESSSSDEEEEERRVSDELLGKICTLDGPEHALVLVVSPACNEELVVKKDQCLVRSFGDGKFSTVLRRNLTTLGSTWKPELCDSKGADSAQAFLRSAEVPEVWKMDLSQILESSSDSDDKHSEEEPEPEEELKKKATAESEPEEEADPEERDRFLQQLYKFMEDRGTPINKPPVLGYKDLNLFKLFRLVTLHGGYGGIESGTVWKQIYMDLGIPVLNSAAAYNVKTAYRKYLCGFEEFCRSALITFRTVHHNEPRPPASPTNQRPPPETKTGSPANHRAAEQKDSPLANQRAAGADLKDAVKMEPEAESESDSETEEHLTSPRGRRRCVLPLKDELRDSRKRMSRQNDQSERGGRLTDQSERGSEDEEDDDEEDVEERLLNPTERGDSDPDADSLAGTRVRVKYGRGKTQKIYEAHIKKTDNDNGENFYLVHYYGWNVRYDEWVKGDRIIWPSEKGKKKRRGKIKNKEEPEGEEERLLKDEPPPKGSGRRGRPLGSKNKSNGRPTERPGLANGDNTPRRRTRRTSGMFDSDRASNEDSGNSSDDSESEDSTEKKPFPWRQAEGGPPGGEEEEPSEGTPPSETTAPSMHQEPSQSQQRAEPEAAANPERKETPPSETPPKLKLPLVLPPRSEPMVLLHHCLPPDSDTDSASESDSEREEAGEEGDATVKTEEQPTEEEMTEERGRSPEKNTKSPLRPVNLRSPSALRTPPPREKPQSEKSEVMKSPPPQTQDKVHKETPQEEPRPKPEENQLQNTPHDETGSEDRTPSTSEDRTMSTSEDRTPSTSEDRTPSTSEDRTPSTSEDRTPSTSEDRTPSTSEDRTPSTSEDRTPSTSNDDRAPSTSNETTPSMSNDDRAPSTHGSITPQNSPRRGDRTLPENSPKRDRIQLENSPKRSDRIQLENSPKRSDRIQLGNSPKRDRVKPENSPRRGDRTLPENSPKRDRIQLENSPKRSDRIQMEMSPRRSDRIQMENSPRRGHGEEQSAAAAERSEDNATPLKRKAPEQKTPDKKLKMEPEVSKTTNMAAAEEESPLEEPSVKAETAVGGEKAMAGGAKAAEAEHVPEMGVDALVCHEVDLDEPDEREKVSASEQLMLMRESHLLRAPPTAPKAPPPQESCGETQRGGGRHEESNGDRGQKRVLEGPHSPTVKKHKRPSHKRLTPHKPDKNGAGLSSDSEDQSHKHCPSPTNRGHKWTLHIDDLEKMSSAERISFLQEKLQEIRKYYLSLKSEVASIDRRRKRLKKKEREVSNTASASSSDAAMSPSSSSPSQSSLTVEVR